MSETPSKLKTLEHVQAAPEGGRVVGVGVFDGVHRGHQRIVSEVVSKAAALGASPTVVTFYPHPEEVLGSGEGPGLLATHEERTELLEALGVEEVVTVEFDLAFSRLLPEEFCELVLSTRLGARLVLVGENFRFGRDGSGDMHDLEAFGKEHGFGVQAVELVAVDGGPVSSTRIRRALRQGDVEEAARLLGRPYRLEGRVVHGVGRGRGLDAPTANLAVSRGLVVPEDGVYVTRSRIENGGSWYASVTSIGSNPTFVGSGETTVETLLLDYSGDLYDSSLKVEFLEKLRRQVEFADADALAQQIRADVRKAREAHGRLRGDADA